MAAKRTKKSNNTWLFIAIAAIIFYWYAMKKGGLKSVFLTTKQLAGMYRELVSSPQRIYETVDGEDIPWQHVLAGYTTDYPELKTVYLQVYNRDLTQDLLNWFTPIELSEYVAELYKNGQLIS